MKKNKTHVMNAVRELMRKDQSLNTLSKISRKIVNSDQCLYRFRCGGVVSIKDLKKISKFFKIDYADVVWEYRDNFSQRLLRPGRGE